MLKFANHALQCRIYIQRIAIICLFIAATSQVNAASSDVASYARPGAPAIDPFEYISKYGFDRTKIGDDGATVFITKEVVVSRERTKQLEDQVAKLDKDERVMNLCMFFSGAMKAKLIEDQGIELDVALINYGHDNAVAACSYRLIVGNKTGALIVFNRAHAGKLYSLHFREHVVN